MTPVELTAALKEEALRLGFDLAAATPAIESPDFEHVERWVNDGFAGEMHYLRDRLPALRHPRHVLEGAKSLLMLATNYRTVEPNAPRPGQAIVSRYAWGADYHEVLGGRLRELADVHRRLAPGAAVRGVVDTAPLLERQFARLAGLGWIGRNTLLINERLGSWLLLSALLTSEELAYDSGVAADRCGSCRACLDACPTGALVAPRRLDARKCISYLTVEKRNGSQPDRDVCRKRLLGCDACQEACPWNRSTPTTMDESFYPDPGMNPVDLAELAGLDDDAYRRRFRHTPLWRPRHAIRAAVTRNTFTEP